ncbi:hypothetical protein QOT17_008453 [Balamuthia mandrillaris]
MERPQLGEGGGGGGHSGEEASRSWWFPVRLLFGGGGSGPQQQPNRQQQQAPAAATPSPTKHSEDVIEPTAPTSTVLQRTLEEASVLASPTSAMPLPLGEAEKKGEAEEDKDKKTYKGSFVWQRLPPGHTLPDDPKEMSCWTYSDLARQCYSPSYRIKTFYRTGGFTPEECGERIENFKTCLLLKFMSREEGRKRLAEIKEARKGDKGKEGLWEAREQPPKFWTKFLEEEEEQRGVPQKEEEKEEEEKEETGLISQLATPADASEDFASRR